MTTRLTGVMLLLFGLLARGHACETDCSNRGTCVSGKCGCIIFYDGDDCSNFWGADPTWYAIFLLYRTSGLVENSVLVVWSAYQLLCICLHSKEVPLSRENCVAFCAPSCSSYRSERSLAVHRGDMGDAGHRQWGRVYVKLTSLGRGLMLA